MNEAIDLPRIEEFMRRNVIDEYKLLTDEEIRTEVSKNTLPFAILMEHWEQDFNISTLLRNANAIGAREVFYVGQKKWDRRGAVGVQSYSSLKFLRTDEEFFALSESYNFVAFEKTEGSVPLPGFVWPENPLIIVGSESLGIRPEVLQFCKYKVQIPQRGSVRSMNAAAAGTVAMYDFMAKLK
jgi:tRNA G18 (ribose-2'-O)-methylase SpoU